MEALSTVAYLSLGRFQRLDYYRHRLVLPATFKVASGAWLLI
jgi:hypothetical protein